MILDLEKGKNTMAEKYNNMNITKEGDEQSSGTKRIMMQTTVEYINKTNPSILKELEKGPKFDVGGSEETGFYYAWDLDDDTPTRKLLDGRQVVELEEPMSLSVTTKCPEKWILQDIETGQIYQGSLDETPFQQWKLITTIEEKKPKNEK